VTQAVLGLRGTRYLLNLLTGFLALGLVVGIAGLGVISTRAVVERRQQIGMMRAIGYRRSHVQRSFLMESSYIAILGLVNGGLVGLWQSYQFFVTPKTLGSVVFHVPVVELVLILVGSYAATLITTYLPARSASRGGPGRGASLRVDIPTTPGWRSRTVRERRPPRSLPPCGGGGPATDRRGDAQRRGPVGPAHLTSHLSDPHPNPPPRGGGAERPATDRRGDE
jgi:hypothetical protein